MLNEIKQRKKIPFSPLYVEPKTKHDTELIDTQNRMAIARGKGGW